MDIDRSLESSDSLLFKLPVEVLGNISNYCFNDYRLVCKFMKTTAYPFLTILEPSFGRDISLKPTGFKEIDVSAKLKTQTNCLILGLPVNPKYEIGDIQRALYFACYTGNLELAKYCTPILENIIESYVVHSDSLNPHESDDYLCFVCIIRKAMISACSGGKLKLVKWCYSEGASDNTPLSRGFEEACKTGNKTVAEWCLLQLKNYYMESYTKLLVFESDSIGRIILNSGLEYACGNGQLEMANWCKLHGATDYGKAFLSACSSAGAEQNSKEFRGSSSGQLITTKWCLEQIFDATESSFCSTRQSEIRHGFLKACNSGNIELAKLITETYGKFVVSDFNRGLVEASGNCKLNMVKWLIEQGADDFNRALHYACKYDNIEIIKFIRKHKPNYKRCCDNITHVEIFKIKKVV